MLSGSLVTAAWREFRLRMEDITGLEVNTAMTMYIK
jgi:hypothetical protein